MPSASVFTHLDCQTYIRVDFDRQGVFPALSNPNVDLDDGVFRGDLSDDVPLVSEFNGTSHRQGEIAAPTR